MIRKTVVAPVTTAVALVTVTLAVGIALAAPSIQQLQFSLPAQAHVGDPLLLFADGLAAPVRVFFSDGANPTLEATQVVFDAARGAVLTRVPAGAVTGNMKISANGVDSPLFYLRILPGTFVQGADTVSGQVTNGATPVAGATLVLVRDTGCVEPTVQDFGVSDSNGQYALAGVDGNYQFFVLPPLTSGLAGQTPALSLSAGPTTLNVSLTAGTNVTGRVVDATTPTTGIAGARLLLNGPAQDALLADAGGNFTIHLAPGSWQFEAHGSGHAFNKVGETIAGASQNVGNILLSSGVKVSGLLTRASDGTPLPGSEIDAFGPNFCCGKFDKTYTLGDGSYALFVPANQTIFPVALMDDRAVVADALGGNRAIGTSNVVVNLQAVDAAFINGTVTDSGTLAAIRNLQLLATSSASVAIAFTCADGRYHLRVAPDPVGYVVGTNASDPSGPAYAYQFWNATPSGTYFGCEGAPVSTPGVGGTTGGINFRVPRAVSVMGVVSSSAAGCANDLGSQAVVIDDGAGHGCGMGVVSPAQPPPGYRVDLLPPSSAVSQLRACSFVDGFDAQCFNAKAPPGYDPIVISAGNSMGGINFCLSTCVVPATWYRDIDGDGHGAAGTTTTSCSKPAGYVGIGDDCDDANQRVWATPGEASGLVFNDSQTFSWTPPASLGGLAVAYDALRSPNPADFLGAATCIESNDATNTVAVDASNPAIASAFFYLVRAENSCPSGQGLLGRNSAGAPIAGRACP